MKLRGYCRITLFVWVFLIISLLSVEKARADFYQDEEVQASEIFSSHQKTLYPFLLLPSSALNAFSDLETNPDSPTGQAIQKFYKDVAVSKLQDPKIWAEFVASLNDWKIQGGSSPTNQFLIDLQKGLQSPSDLSKENKALVTYAVATHFLRALYLSPLEVRNKQAEGVFHFLESKPEWKAELEKVNPTYQIYEKTEGHGAQVAKWTPTQVNELKKILQTFSAQISDDDLKAFQKYSDSTRLKRFQEETQKKGHKYYQLLMAQGGWFVVSLFAGISAWRANSYRPLELGAVLQDSDYDDQIYLNRPKEWKDLSREEVASRVEDLMPKAADLELSFRARIWNRLRHPFGKPEPEILKSMNPACLEGFRAKSEVRSRELRAQKFIKDHYGSEAEKAWLNVNRRWRAFRKMNSERMRLAHEKTPGLNSAVAQGGLTLREANAEGEAQLNSLINLDRDAKGNSDTHLKALDPKTQSEEKAQTLKSMTDRLRTREDALYEQRMNCGGIIAKTSTYLSRKLGGGYQRLRARSTMNALLDIQPGGNQNRSDLDKTLPDGTTYRMFPGSSIGERALHSGPRFILSRRQGLRIVQILAIGVLASTVYPVRSKALKAAHLKDPNDPEEPTLLNTVFTPSAEDQLQDENERIDYLKSKYNLSENSNSFQNSQDLYEIGSLRDELQNRIQNVKILLDHQSLSPADPSTQLSPYAYVVLVQSQRPLASVEEQELAYETGVLVRFKQIVDSDQRSLWIPDRVLQLDPSNPQMENLARMFAFTQTGKKLDVEIQPKAAQSILDQMQVPEFKLASNAPTSAAVPSP